MGTARGFEGSIALWSEADGDPKRMTRRAPSSITSTRPKLDVRSKTIRGAVAAVAAGLRAAAHASPASASMMIPGTIGDARVSDLVKETFLSLNSGRVTTKALRVSIGVFALLLGALFSTVAEAAPKRVGV